MNGRYLNIGIISFAVSLAISMTVATPAKSCAIPYHGSYPGTRVVVIGGSGFCGGYGVNCIESGCAGEGYCVQDGIVQRCYRDV